MENKKQFSIKSLVESKDAEKRTDQVASLKDSAALQSIACAIVGSTIGNPNGLTANQGM